MTEWANTVKYNAHTTVLRSEYVSHDFECCLLIFLLLLLVIREEASKEGHTSTRYDKHGSGRTSPEGLQNSPQPH